MKTVPPISKRCKVCKEKKLLSEFEINERIKDKRENVCKSCREPVFTCEDCVTSRIFETAEPMIDLLTDLVRNGERLPNSLFDKTATLIHLAGISCVCDECAKKIG